MLNKSETKIISNIICIIFFFYPATSITSNQFNSFKSMRSWFKEYFEILEDNFKVLMQFSLIQMYLLGSSSNLNATYFPHCLTVSHVLHFSPIFSISLVFVWIKYAIQFFFHNSALVLRKGRVKPGLMTDPTWKLESGLIIFNDPWLAWPDPTRRVGSYISLTGFWPVCFLTLAKKNNNIGRS